MNALSADETLLVAGSSPEEEMERTDHLSSHAFASPDAIAPIVRSARSTKRLVTSFGIVTCVFGTLLTAVLWSMNESLWFGVPAVVTGLWLLATRHQVRQVIRALSAEPQKVRGIHARTRKGGRSGSALIQVRLHGRTRPIALYVEKTLELDEVLSAFEQLAPHAPISESPSAARVTDFRSRLPSTS